MKLVYSGNNFSGRLTSNATPSLLNLQMQKGMAQSKLTSGAMSSETLSHAPSYSQQHVMFKVSQVQLQASPSNEDLAEDNRSSRNS